MKSIKKQLSESQFQETIKSLDIGQQTINIAYEVLVKGTPQVTFVTALNLSRGAISQAVHRVWAAHETRNLPNGYERVIAILPQHQAFVVKKWAIEAAKKTEPQK